MERTPSDVQRELQEKEAFNFALFQHNPAPMTVVDLQGRVVKSNLARRRSPQPLPPLGEPLFQNSGGASGTVLQTELMECIRTGRVSHYPERAVDTQILAITMAPFPQGAIVITEDITERKAAEDLAKVQREQLIQAQKMAALGTLVSGVAHEVSNPNNVMILSTSVLRGLVDDLLAVADRVRATGPEREEEASSSLGLLKADVLEQVEVLARSAERIRSLVQELKDFARREESETRRPLDINQVVADAVTLLGPMIKKATDRLTVDYAPATHVVLGNAQRLEQVVVNLLANACQALPDRTHGVTVKTHLDGVRRRIQIIVQDEGVGIAPELLGRIKDPFFTTRHDAGGTGLGLSVSDKIVTSHGGTLTFQSELGSGTTAVVSLPCAKDAGAGGSSSDAKRAPASRGRGRS
jgi:signal transduction histidine kinase